MVLGTLIKHRLLLKSLEAKHKGEDSNQEKIATELKTAKKRYQDTWALYQKMPKFNAYYVRIKTSYTDIAVHQSLEKLDAVLQVLQKSKTIDEVYNNMEPVNRAFWSVAKAMGSEISLNSSNKANAADAKSRAAD